MHEAAGPAIELLNKLLDDPEATATAPTMQAYVRQRIAPAMSSIERFVQIEEELARGGEPSSYYDDARRLLALLALPSLPVAPLAPPLRRNSSNGYQTRARNRQRM